MTKVEGDEAWEFHHRICEQHERENAEALARAREEAVARGKEPFDLDKLEQLADTSREGVMDPREERQKYFEDMYYVGHPDFMTLEDLAKHIYEISRW